MILMNDFKKEPEDLVRQQLAAAERVFRSGWWILGSEVKEFEAAWAARCQVRHAIGVGNGMDALEIGLRALSIGPGDEVITTPMTAFASVLSILRCGATPVFADIDPATAILDPEQVRRSLSPRTRAVMVVHLYGRAAPMDAFLELCEEKGLHLVEDCAQAHGASWNGRPLGSLGAFGGWSFYPTKNLGAVGDAGALTTDSEALADRARRLRNYGQSTRYHHPDLGLNSRLDELHAAILRARLERLSAWIQRRREVAIAYAEGIRNPSVRTLPPPEDPHHHVHYLFVLTSPDRDRLQTHLKTRGIDSLIHYPIPAHRQPPCESLSRSPLPNAERHAAECLSVPCHPALSDADVVRVIEAVNAFE